MTVNSGGSINLSSPDVLHEFALNALRALHRAVGGDGWLDAPATDIVAREFPGLNTGQISKILDALLRLGLVVTGGDGAKDYVSTDVREFSKQQLIVGKPVIKPLRPLDETELSELNLVLLTMREKGSPLPGVFGTARTTLTLKEAINQVLLGGAEPQKKDTLEKWIYRLGLCFIWGDGSNVVDLTIPEVTPQMLANGRPLVQWAERRQGSATPVPETPNAPDAPDDESNVRQLLRIIQHLEGKNQSLVSERVQLTGSLEAVTEQRDQLKRIVQALERQVSDLTEALDRKTQVASAQSQQISELTRDLETLRQQQRAAQVAQDPEIATLIAKYGSVLGERGGE